MTESVAILDAKNFQVLFQDSHPMSVSVQDNKRLTRFAVEDGTTRTDHAVKDPIEISISFRLTDDIRNQYELMRAAYLSNDLVVVQTQTANYPSMQIETFPNEQEYGSVDCTMTLVEVEFVRPEYGPLPPEAVREPGDASTLNRGQQQTTQSGQSSTLFRLLS